MGTHTGIEWTQATWNPIVGCSVVSPGCTNCYAMTMAARLEAMGTLKQYAGTTRRTKAGPVWTGKLALAPEATLLAPLRRRKPTTYFVNSMGDLFHEDIPDEWIDRVFAVMALAPQHTFQILTKRSARMRAYFAETWQLPARGAIRIDDTLTVPARPARTEDRWEQINSAIDAITMDPLFEQDRFWTPEGSVIGRPVWPRQPLPNVWLGISAEDQRRADERIPDLLATPAAIRFVSAEPLLGPIDFRDITVPQQVGTWQLNALECDCPDDEDTDLAGATLDWIIVGGESGKGARPMHPDWARSIRDQCAAAGTAFFFKQWSAWAPLIDRERDDPDWRKDYSYRFADNDQTRWLNLAGGRGFHGERFHVMGRASKAKAGRLLDGVTHDGMPEAPHG